MDLRKAETEIDETFILYHALRLKRWKSPLVIPASLAENSSLTLPTPKSSLHLTIQPQVPLPSELDLSFMVKDRRRRLLKADEIDGEDIVVVEVDDDDENQTQPPSKKINVNDDGRVVDKQDDTNRQLHSNQSSLLSTPLVSSQPQPPSSSSSLSSSSITTTTVSVKEYLSDIELLRNKMESLERRADKFHKRMNEKDPVTGASRYGTNTAKRVTSFLERYEALGIGMEMIETGNNDNSNSSNSSNNSNSSNDKQHQTTPKSILQTLQILQKSESEYHHQEKILAEREAIAQQIKIDEDALQSSQIQIIQENAQIAERVRIENELAMNAENARSERLLSIERRKMADEHLVQSIVKGEEGVKIQLKRLKDECRACPNGTDDSSSIIHTVALKALCTIFKQIKASPDILQFRRVRRNHPRFMSDVGRHVGGVQLLIAAGFRFKSVYGDGDGDGDGGGNSGDSGGDDGNNNNNDDGVQCLILHEPNLEHDMDGWYAWFNLVEKTLALIEAEIASMGL